MASEKKTYFYNNPLINLSVTGRFIVRAVSYIGYGVAIIGGLIFWSSDVAQLHAAGAIIGLYLASRLVKANKPERALTHLSLRHPNIALYVSPRTERLVESAFDKASLHGGDVELRLLKALLLQPEIKQILIRMDVDHGGFSQKVDGYLTETMRQGKQSNKDRVAAIERLMIGAFLRAANNYGTAVKVYYLFGAFGDSQNEHIKRLFSLFAITSSDIETAFLFGKGRRPHLQKFVSGTFKNRHRVMNRAWTARPTPTLDQFGTDLTDRVREMGSWLLIGHKTEYERLVNVLSRPGNPNALLIGDPGSGKTAITYYLAFQVIKDRVPAQLFDRRLVALSISSLSAGATPAQISERLKVIVNEILVAGNIILCIPDIHLLLKSDGGQISGADVLIPAIQGGEFSVVGGTYPKEYKQYIEQNNEFNTSFEAIKVNELSEEESVQYLVYASLVLEAQSKITITFKALKEAVRIAHKYFRHKLLPSSAEDILKEALAGAALRRDGVLNPDDVIATAEQKINVKLHAAGKEEASALLNLEATIHEQFIDQEEAVKAVANALREYRAGVTRKGGPIASFLFCGPTGVGKTELSKILAETQFGDKNTMERFDMTEYQDKQSYYRLIGSPDGTMRGALTEAVMEKPYSLILLDEFEKAYPDILNLFLQVLDDGRLTDNFGRTVDFQNTIIIATSNAHSVLIKEELEQGAPIKTITDLLKKRLTEYFKPELINRFSQLVVFKPLSEKDIYKVAQLNLADLSKTLIESQSVVLKYEDAAIAEIARRGYDPLFGARPLRQAINNNLRSVLADQILRGKIVRGDTIIVRWSGEAFGFEKQVEGVDVVE